MTGAYSRGSSGRGKSRAEMASDLDKVYTYFPRLQKRRSSQSGYTSGGEQQMTAIGRALMARPSMILLDEPSMGLGATTCRRDLQHRARPECKGRSVVLASGAEHQSRVEIREVRLHLRKRPCRNGWRGPLTARKRGREGVLSRPADTPGAEASEMQNSTNAASAGLPEAA